MFRAKKNTVVVVVYFVYFSCISIGVVSFFGSNLEVVQREYPPFHTVVNPEIVVENLKTYSHQAKARVKAKKNQRISNKQQRKLSFLFGVNGP